MRYVLNRDFIQYALRALEDRRNHQQIVMYLAVLKQYDPEHGDKKLSTDIMNDDLRKWLYVPSDGELPEFPK